MSSLHLLSCQGFRHHEQVIERVKGASRTCKPQILHWGGGRPLARQLPALAGLPDQCIVGRTRHSLYHPTICGRTPSTFDYRYTLQLSKMGSDIDPQMGDKNQQRHSTPKGKSWME